MKAQIDTKAALHDILNLRDTYASNRVVEQLKDHWSFDLDDRRPGPAILANGDVKPTDLDLACLLSTLAKRNAVVTLPKYLSSGTGKTGNANQQVLSGDRRGKLLKLSSNKEYFSFNALVQDMSVQDMSTGALGAPRYFHVLGKDGRWHPGWDTINFVADAKENDFIKTFGLAVDAQVAFKTFVSPSRWTAFYGDYYTLTKLAIERLETEAKELRIRIKAFKAGQIQTGKPESTWQKDDSDGSFPTKTITVPVFEAEVDGIFVGTFYSPFTGDPRTETRLRDIESSLSELRFATRATELAFYKARGEKAGIPGWDSSARWSEETIKRTTWRKLTGGWHTINPLRYRIRAKAIEVAA